MVDEDVIVDKLRHINRYTDDLKQMRGMSKEEYVEDMVIPPHGQQTGGSPISSFRLIFDSASSDYP